jgi:hypothetical protein
MFKCLIDDDAELTARPPILATQIRQLRSSVNAEIESPLHANRSLLTARAWRHLHFSFQVAE